MDSIRTAFPSSKPCSGAEERRALKAHRFQGNAAELNLSSDLNENPEYL